MILDDADAAVGIILWDSKVLLLRRGVGCPHFPSQFCLPGGLLDEGESPLDAAIRETFEETGILIPKPAWVWHERQFSETDRPVQVEVYRAVIDTPQPVVLSYEHDAHLWHPISDPVPETTTPMNHRIIEGVLTAGAATTSRR